MCTGYTTHPHVAAHDSELQPLCSMKAEDSPQGPLLPAQNSRGQQGEAAGLGGSWQGHAAACTGKQMHGAATSKTWHRLHSPNTLHYTTFFCPFPTKHRYHRAGGVTRSPRCHYCRRHPGREVGHPTPQHSKIFVGVCVCSTHRQGCMSCYQRQPASSGSMPRPQQTSGNSCTLPPPRVVAACGVDSSAPRVGREQPLTQPLPPTSDKSASQCCLGWAANGLGAADKTTLLIFTRSSPGGVRPEPPPLTCWPAGPPCKHPHPHASQ
jgi:hypothetical protein